LDEEVGEIFRTRWDERDGITVPSDDSVGLGNEGVRLTATVLYADMSDSTALVNTKSNTFAAEIYKTYLHCAAKIIRSEGGAVTAYDGDRVMAVFMGDVKNTPAARTALKINYALREIVTPAMKKIYSSTNYIPRGVVGIDTSKLFVAKTGVRGANDLVWVGRAANYAAKLTALPHAYASYITAPVFQAMLDEIKFWDGRAIWQPVLWDTFNNETIYRSNWSWVV
jgi:class 3 adenylate cyclase